MSRHTLEPRDNNDYDIAVGWDGPLATFYAQVIADDFAVLDRGGPGDRILNPGEALNLARDYAVIPIGIENTLLLEAQADGHRIVAA